MTDDTYPDLRILTDGEFELVISRHRDDSYRVWAAGLARALGHRDARDMVKPLPEDQRGFEPCRTLGGHQQVLHVTKAGMYQLIGQRRPADIHDLAVRDAVIRFQTWVFAEVLPSIRCAGHYATEAAYDLVLVEYTLHNARLARIAGRPEREATLHEQARQLAWAASDRVRADAPDAVRVELEGVGIALTGVALTGQRDGSAT